MNSIRTLTFLSQDLVALLQETPVTISVAASLGVNKVAKAGLQIDKQQGKVIVSGEGNFTFPQLILAFGLPNIKLTCSLSLTFSWEFPKRVGV